MDTVAVNVPLHAVIPGAYNFKAFKCYAPYQDSCLFYVSGD